MFLRQTRRKKDGKTHSYWSVVENQRLQGGRVAPQLPPQQPPKITTIATAGVT
jgi:hypothetical protein